jgi:multisubunit Na+/H+ antiporter MnhG subunit
MSELARAIADLRRERTTGTVAIYAALGAMMLLVASLPVCGRVQDQFARAHHARPTSTASWVVFQLAPKMYSFEHRVWFSRELLTEFLVTRPQGAGVDNEVSSVNHYPVRAARFEGMRDEIVQRGEDVYVLVRSAYRGRSWVSRYVVRVVGDELVLEVVE